MATPMRCNNNIIGITQQCHRRPLPILAPSPLCHFCMTFSACRCCACVQCLSYQLSRCFKVKIIHFLLLMGRAAALIFCQWVGLWGVRVQSHLFLVADHGSVKYYQDDIYNNLRKLQHGIARAAITIIFLKQEWRLVIALGVMAAIAGERN